MDGVRHIIDGFYGSSITAIPNQRFYVIANLLLALKFERPLYGEGHET